MLILTSLWSNSITTNLMIRWNGQIVKYSVHIILFFLSRARLPYLDTFIYFSYHFWIDVMCSMLWEVIHLVLVPVLWPKTQIYIILFRLTLSHCAMNKPFIYFSYTSRDRVHQSYNNMVKWHEQNKYIGGEINEFWKKYDFILIRFQFSSLYLHDHDRSLMCVFMITYNYHSRSRSYNIMCNAKSNHAFEISRNTYQISENWIFFFSLTFL